MLAALLNQLSANMAQTAVLVFLLHVEASSSGKEGGHVTQREMCSSVAVGPGLGYSSSHHLFHAHLPARSFCVSLGFLLASTGSSR
jgi:hypothetical protein